MIRLNLLPYRERRQQRQRQGFQRWLAALFTAGCAVVLSAALMLTMQYRQQHGRVQILQREHSELDRQIIRTQALQQQNQQLHAHLAQLEQLQQQRNDAVKLLSALARHTPAGIALRSIRQDAGQLALHGYANSHQDILSMLDGLKDSGVFETTKIRQTTQSGQRYDFIMTAAINAREAAP